MKKNWLLPHWPQLKIINKKILRYHNLKCLCLFQTQKIRIYFDAWILLYLFEKCDCCRCCYSCVVEFHFQSQLAESRQWAEWNCVVWISLFPTLSYFLRTPNCLLIFLELVSRELYHFGQYRIFFLAKADFTVSKTWQNPCFRAFYQEYDYFTLTNCKLSLENKHIFH